MYMLAENYVHPSHAKNTQTMYIFQYAVNTKKQPSNSISFCAINC